MNDLPRPHTAPARPAKYKNIIQETRELIEFSRANVLIARQAVARSQALRRRFDGTDRP